MSEHVDRLNAIRQQYVDARRKCAADFPGSNLRTMITQLFDHQENIDKLDRIIEDERRLIPAKATTTPLQF